MFARVQQRGRDLRRRRRIAAMALPTVLAAGIASVVLAFVPGKTARPVAITPPLSSPDSLHSCPDPPFSILPTAAGSLPPAAALSSGSWRHLGAGQSAVLFAGKRQTISLSRGVDPNAFSVSVWSHGPKPLTPVRILGTTTDLFPQGYGATAARIPFRFPQDVPSDACRRFQLEGAGVSDDALITVAQSLQPTLAKAPGTTRSSSVTAPPSTSLATPAVGAYVFGRSLANPTVTVSANTLYVTWTTSSGSTQASDVARVEPTTGRIEAITQLGGSFDQAVQASGSLWATTVSAAGVMLNRLDPQTLTLTGQWPLGGTGNMLLPGHDMAVAGGSLWVAVQDRLLRVSLPAGGVSLTLPLGGASSSDVAADASGVILIVGEANESGVGTIQRRDSTTGALLASRPMTGVAAPLVAAVTPSEVWVSESTGMMGYFQQLDAISLAPSPTDIKSCAHHPTPACIEGTNAFKAILTQGSLWIAQTAGASAHNYCGNLSNGEVLGTIPLPQPDQDNIEAIGAGQIYYVSYVAGGEQIAHQAIPAACLSS